MFIPCPIHQCGGNLIPRDSKREEEESWQIPDLVCDNCHGIYSFTKFETGTNGN